MTMFRSWESPGHGQRPRRVFLCRCWPHGSRTSCPEPTCTPRLARCLQFQPDGSRSVFADSGDQFANDELGRVPGAVEIVPASFVVEVGEVVGREAADEIEYADREQFTRAAFPLNGAAAGLRP
ncbi:hypothetical protein GCM10010358_74260 [Streptomyces minutiscleroticus]|uniref:Uncharacterized protein n=1 Tax=Streptomyces minutiscleroticus TaxID=68238 RepID=A0A918U979_9ACTN|nr:hypothetical protein GCM10010358_74260 [Streptomyces minutiscleroticus]